jgi:hypothetical protein
MKILKLKKEIVNANYLMGEFLTDNDYDLLIDYDCDVYDKNGKLLAKFRKNVLTEINLLNCVKNIRKAITLQEGRGVTSGKVDISKTRYRNRKAHTTEGFKLQGVGLDGRKLKMKFGNQFLGGIIGYMDRTVMMPYCRKTAYTKNEFEKFKKAIPFIKEVDDKYKKLIPEKWEIQNQYAKATDNNYVIEGTTFTTVTVNKDFQTAVHKDVGDLKKGFGNLSCYKTKGSKGGYFVLPEYKIAFDLGSTDLLLVDVHKWHGNTPIINETEEDERISFVMYYREKTIKCLSPSDELERVKRANNKL